MVSLDVASIDLRLLFSLGYLSQYLNIARRDQRELDLNDGFVNLYPAIKPINVSNSCVFPSIHSTKGCFKLQFWLYVPESCITKLEAPKEGSDVFYVHILSRLPEATDVNHIFLFEVLITCLDS